MKTYTVEARLKHPSCFHSGYDLTIIAKNKAEAIRSARRRVWTEGHTRVEGPLTFRAIEQED